MPSVTTRAPAAINVCGGRRSTQTAAPITASPPMPPAKDSQPKATGERSSDLATEATTTLERAASQERSSHDQREAQLQV